MTPKFFYAFVNPGMEEWLKEEIKARELPLKLSFSRPGYMTFKLDHQNLKLSELPSFAFARCFGEFQRKQAEPLSSHTNGEEYIEVFQATPNEYWVGARKGRSFVRDRLFDHREFNPEASGIPSRTYYKTQQAFELLGLKAPKHAFEVGAAPGGSVAYLLEQGSEVTGLDPGQMDALVMENPRFTHLCQPIQALTQEDVPASELLSIDLNLSFDQSLKEIARVLPWFQKARTVLFILKVPRSGEVESFLQAVQQWTKILGEQSFFLQLPAHRRETLLVIQKGAKR